MIFDRILVRFRKDLSYRSLFYVVNIIISGSTSTGDFHYISFFGGEASDMAFDKIPSRIYKNAPIKMHVMTVQSFNSYL